MPSNIESRIVSMTFDNSQFEKGVATSQKSLDSLNKKLSFKDADKSFKNLTESASQVSFSSVVSRAEEMGFKIKASTIAGAEVIKRLTNSVLDLGKSIVNHVTSPLSGAIAQAKQGGWNRATNIDQAKFQLQGLHVAWEDISEDIDYGVKDTAYGLDSAARVASQLVASNVELGDDMKAALRGISGVAAMTNSTYDDIGAVFTRVAGQGRVMANDLNSLAFRGLNAAAELGNAMGYTEAEIRDMVSKGKIDFKTFAYYMDKAFGEHAKKANETFEGAMSNMNSALSRIGAEFASSYRTNMIPVYNALRTTFNGVKGSMSEVFLTADAIMTDLSERFTKYVGVFNKYVIDSGVLKSIFTGIANYAEGAYNVVTGIVDTLINAYRIVVPDLHSMGVEMSKWGEFADEFKKDVFRKPAATFNEMSRKFLELTQNKDFIDKLVSKIQTIASISTSIFHTIRNLMSSAFTIARILGKAFGAVGHIIGDIFSRFTGKSKVSFTGLFSGLEEGSAKLSAWLKKIEEWLDTNDIFQKAVDYTAQAIDKLIEWANKAIDKIKELANSFDDWVKKMTGSSVGEHFDKIKEHVSGALDKVKEFFKSSKLTIDKNELSKGLGPLQKFWEGIKHVFSGIVSVFKALFPVVKTLFHELWDSFKEIFSNLGDMLKNLKFKDLIDAISAGGAAAGGIGLLRIASSIKKFVNKLKSFFAGKTNLSLFPTLSSFLSGLKSSLSQVATAASTDLKADALLKTAKAVAILAASVFALALLDPKKVLFSLGAIEALLVTVKGITKSLGGFKGSNKTIVTFGASLMLMSIGIAILAGAIIALGATQTDKLIDGLLAVEAILLMFTGVIKRFYKIAQKGKVKGLISIGIALALIGLAIRLLVKPIQRLGEIDTKVLVKGLVAVFGSVAAMVAIAGKGKKSAINFLAISIAFIAFAKAVQMLIDPLHAMEDISWPSVLKILALMAGFSVIGLVLKPAAKALASVMFSLISVLFSVTASIPLIAAGIAMLAGSLSIVANVLQKFTDIPWDALKKAGVALLGFIVVLGALTALIKSGVIGDAKFTSLLKVYLTMAIIVGALQGMSAAIKSMNDTPWESLAKAGAAMVALVAISAAMTALSNHGMMTPKGFMALRKISVLFTILVTTLGALSVVMKTLNTVEWESMDKAAVAMLGFIGMAVVLSKAADTMKSIVGMIGASIALVIMAKSLQQLVPVLIMLEKVKPGSILKFLGILAGLTVVGIAISPVLGKLSKGLLTFSISLLFITLSMDVATDILNSLVDALVRMVPVFKSFSTISWGSLAKAGVVLLAFVGVLVALEALAKGGIMGDVDLDEVIKMGLSMLTISAALVLFTKSLTSLSDIPWSSLAKAGVILVALVAVLAAMAILPVDNVAGGLLKISLAVLVLVGDLLLLGVILPLIASTFKGSLQEGLQALIEITPLFIEFLNQLVIGLLQIINNAIPQVVEIITNLVNGVLQILIDTTPKLYEVMVKAIPYILLALMALLLALRDFSYNATRVIIDILVNVLVAIFDGLTARMEEIMDSVFKFIETFVVEFFEHLWDEIKKLWDWLRDVAWPWLQDRGPEILSDIWDGITAGLRWIKDKIVGAGKWLWGKLTGDDSYADDAYDTASQMGKAVEEGFNDSLEIQSPSKKTEESAGYACEGVLNGLSGFMDKIKGGGSDLGGSLLSGFDSSLNGTDGGLGLGGVLQNAIGNLGGEGGLEIPITPIINMDDAQVTGDDDLQWYSDLNGTPVDASTDVYSQITADNANMIASQESNNQLTEQTLSELQGLREDSLTSSEATTDSLDAMSDKLENLQNEMIKQLGDLGKVQAENVRTTNSKITDIRSDLSVLATSINNLKLVLDTGAVAGELTPKIDARLGKMAAYKGRGIS